MKEDTISSLPFQGITDTGKWPQWAHSEPDVGDARILGSWQGTASLGIKASELTFGRAEFQVTEDNYV